MMLPLSNADSRDRTSDLQIFSLTLSQLSYTGVLHPPLGPPLQVLALRGPSTQRHACVGCPSGQMDKASVSGAEDWGFESPLGCAVFAATFFFTLPAFCGFRSYTPVA